MKTFIEYLQEASIGKQVPTVGSVYQDFINKGANPERLKAEFKDLIYNVLTPDQKQQYSMLSPGERALFPLDKISSDGTSQVIELWRIGHRLLQQHKTDAGVAKFHAANPQYTQKQAKGMYLDKFKSPD